MNKRFSIWLVAAGLLIAYSGIALSQEGAKQPLRLVQTIPLSLALDIHIHVVETPFDVEGPAHPSGLRSSIGITLPLQRRGQEEAAILVYAPQDRPFRAATANSSELKVY